MNQQLQQQQPLPLLPQQPLPFIFKNLLLPQSYLNLQHLHHHLFITKSTITNHIKSLKPNLQPFHLNLQPNPNKPSPIKPSEIKIPY
ncbi:helix-turn-helix domain-containing protein, partial [Bacillus altitudinis]|uniref:helix-turn-helix domain-containing protein n=1 Tax=Bacillus altitudinis TaxID=293387 RepID=UPI003B51AB89